MVTLRTNERCTPSPRCFPEQSMQKNTPRFTEAQSTDSFDPQSTHRWLDFSLISLSRCEHLHQSSDLVLSGRVAQCTPLHPEGCSSLSPLISMYGHAVTYPRVRGTTKRGCADPTTPELRPLVTHHATSGCIAVGPATEPT
jgi:hypothetical protein